MKLQIENISKEYGSKQVLKDLSACFEPGINAVLGPNGSGKSTLINILCGNLKPDAGTAYWNDTDIIKTPDSFRAALGYVPQTIAMYPEFTEDEYLGYMAVLKGIARQNRGDEVRRVLQCVSLEKEHRQKTKSLSEGMKRRLLIAQALLGNPKILIMDEPTAGLDPGQRILFKKMLLELAKDKIVIFATHIVPDVENIARKIFFIREGHLVQEEIIQTDAGSYDFMTSLEKRYYSIYGENE